MDAGKYTFRNLLLADISLLPTLYKSAFGIKRNKEYVKRKFFHPYQKVRASQVSMIDNLPASFYGVISQKARFREKEFYIAQSCDSMTHKLHGGKGLFVKLANEAYSELAKQGVDYVYGFPNDTIYNLRIKKLNWIHSTNILVYKQKVTTLPLAKLVKKIPIFSGFYLAFCSLILRKYISRGKRIPNSIIDKNTGGIIHDEAYFNYKSSVDKFIITINGINFWVKLDGFFWVGDFDRTNDEEFNEALKILQKLAVKTGCDHIVFHFEEGTANAALLSKYINVHSKMPVGYINLSELSSGYSFKFCGADFDSW